MNKPLPPLPPRPEPFKKPTNNTSVPSNASGEKTNLSLPARPGQVNNSAPKPSTVFNIPDAPLKQEESFPEQNTTDEKIDITGKKKFPVKLVTILAASVLILSVSAFGITQFLNGFSQNPPTAGSEEPTVGESVRSTEDDPYAMTDEEAKETLEDMESIDEDLDTLEGLLAPRTQQPYPTSTYRSVPLDPNNEHDATFRRVLDMLETPSVYSLEQLKAVTLDGCEFLATNPTKDVYYEWIYSLEDPVEVMEAVALGYRHFCPPSYEVYLGIISQ